MTQPSGSKKHARKWPVKKQQVFLLTRREELVVTFLSRTGKKLLRVKHELVEGQAQVSVEQFTADEEIASTLVLFDVPINR